MPVPPPLKPLRSTVDYSTMLEVGDTKRPEGIPAAEGNLAFVAFTLSHTPCGDGVIEARLGEGLLLQWCLDCAEMRIFRSPGA